MHANKDNGLVHQGHSDTAHCKRYQNHIFSTYISAYQKFSLNQDMRREVYN